MLAKNVRQLPSQNRFLKYMYIPQAIMIVHFDSEGPLSSILVLDLETPVPYTRGGLSCETGLRRSAFYNGVQSIDRILSRYTVPPEARKDI